MDVSSYFDFWEVAKEEEMQVPDQKSSIQVVSIEGHLHNVSTMMTTSVTTLYF